MRALLDTHAFLWAVGGDERLSPVAHNVIADTTNEILFSAASAYEIAVKVARGRLRLPEPVTAYLQTRLVTFAFQPLNITVGHAVRAADLPDHHRDPWDRLLVAQAQAEGVSLITADRFLEQYEIDVLW